jgi:elongation factor P hydroxylase
MAFKPITPKQKTVLDKLGYNASQMSSYSAWLIIGKHRALQNAFGVGQPNGRRQPTARPCT